MHMCVYYLHAQMQNSHARVRKSRPSSLPSGMWDPSGAFKYTERYYLRALDTRGATDSSLQNNTCLAWFPSFESFSLLRAIRWIEPRCASRSRGGFRDNITFRGNLFREISKGRLMDLFCGRLCGFTVLEREIEIESINIRMVIKSRKHIIDKNN